jgi:hypothetical protein
MEGKLNFTAWYLKKYDPSGYIYPSYQLNIGFGTVCLRVNEYLEYLKQFEKQSICCKCDNPIPHRLKDGSYSCDDCGHTWR